MTPVLILCLTLQSPSAWAFYCGNLLVDEGDYKLQVLEKCGQPNYQESRVEYRSIALRGSGINQPGLDIVQQVQVNIDEWTYDFGPHDFMQKLYFENGRLLNIQSLGYGTVNGSR